MVLVTGASGFLGKHLVRYLSDRGHTIRALYNNNAPGKEWQLPGVCWEKYDLLDVYDIEDAMNGVTDIYHCAAILSFDPKRKKEMLHFNAESTCNIVNQALEQGIRKMIYVSSVAALGRGKIAAKEITEEQEWEESGQNTAYGLSKYLAEMEVWRGCGEGLNGVVVNPGIILGAGDNWNEGSPRLIKVAYKEFPFYTQGITSWVDVSDVVTIMYMLMNSDVEGERFILSSGNMAFRDIFTKMAHALEKKPPHIKATKLMTELVWRLEMLKTRFTGATPFITKETARNAQITSYYNNSKILELFPAYTYTPVDTTIARMAQSFMKRSHK